MGIFLMLGSLENIWRKLQVVVRTAVTLMVFLLAFIVNLEQR